MASAVGGVPRPTGARTSFQFTWPLRKRARVAASLRALLHLAAGERVLMRFGSRDGTPLIATDRALYWYPSAAGWSRLGWEEITRLAAGRGESGLVAIGRSGRRANIATDSPQANRRLLALAQERIGATRIVVTQVSIDGCDVLVEGRRQPGTGQLRWFVRLDQGLDASDPIVRGKIERALADVRSALGV